MSYSSQQVAKKLGITGAALSKYIKAKKVPAPKSAVSGGMTLYFWTDEEIEKVRKLLPKIANGRKTRYKKKQSAKAKKKK
jgi:predicted transcriptional regulator